MGGNPFKASAVKTAPAAAVCIAFSWPPQLSYADALFKAHPPMSRLTPGLRQFVRIGAGPDMGGDPFNGEPVKTAPAAAACIAFSWPPQLSHADALLQAHPPISRPAPGFFYILFFLCRPGYGREPIQGETRQNSPGGGRLHSLFMAASTVSCRRAFASAPAHIPACTGHFSILLFSRIRDRTRARGCGSPCGAYPYSGRGISHSCAFLRCRRTLCTPARRHRSFRDCLSS